MDSLILAASTVVPLIVYLVTGGAIRKAGILDEETMRKLNGMIFKVPLPLSLFFDIYSADLRTAVQPRLLLGTFLLICAFFAISWAAVFRLVPDHRQGATMVQGICRSNYVLFGTTIGTSICGEKGAAIAAALAVVVVPTFNVLSVIVFETLRGGKLDPKGLLGRIFRNPLVDAGLLGVLFNLLRIPIPAILSGPLNTLADTATPMALLAMGGLLSFHSMVSHRGYLLTTVFLRLIGVPLIALAIMIAAGYRNEELVILMAVFASPTAVASAPMAQSMGGDGTLAAEIVAVSSAVSILTVFAFTAGLSGLGLI